MQTQTFSPAYGFKDRLSNCPKQLNLMGKLIIDRLITLELTYHITFSSDRHYVECL